MINYRKIKEELNMTGEQIMKVTGILLENLIPTLKIFGFTLLFSIPLGLIVAALKMCRFKPISWLTNLYILIMRGTPLMLQIIVVYYALPFLKTATKGTGGFVESLLSGVDPAAESFMFTMVIIAFVLNYAAYFAEIFRGGIESIPRGQYEAAVLQDNSPAGNKAYRSCVVKRSNYACKGYVACKCRCLLGNNACGKTADDELQLACSAVYCRCFLFRNGYCADSAVRLY